MSAQKGKNGHQEEINMFRQLACQLSTCLFVAGSVHGTAKHANVIAVKTIGHNSEGKLSWIFEGLEWIAQYINKTQSENTTSVINLSLGFDYDELYDFMDDCLEDIPAIVVAAAGNENQDACNIVPARFSSVITVSATNWDDELIYKDEEEGANIGPCIDILAPGDKIVSATNVNSYGEDILSGTSMAAPIVSGVIAQYLQKYNTQVSGHDMKRVLQYSATKLSTNSWTPSTANLLVHTSCGSKTSSSDISTLSRKGVCFPKVNYTPPWKPDKFVPQDHLGTFLIVAVGLIGGGFSLMIIDLWYRRRLRVGRNQQDQTSIY